MPKQVSKAKRVPRTPAINASDSSANEHSGESEVEEQSRSSMVRPRALTRTSSDESGSESEPEPAGDRDADSGAEKLNIGDELQSDGEMAHSGDDDDYFVGDIDAGNDEPEAKKQKLLSEKDVERAQKTERKSGVVYMSRVPPYMKPIQVRHMLEKYAQIGRIYLIEEDENRRKRRVKSGGNRRRQFEEGWIEFKNKKYAKAVAGMLNNTKMGGKRHGFYHDDLWNLKYLPKFKWRHLVEQLASEKAAKEQRLQTEISQSRRELDAYMKNVERAKKMSGMQAKRQAKIDSGKEVKEMEARTRNVWQRDVVAREATDAQPADGKRRRTQDAKVESILSKIF
ncbi:RNA-binding ATPase activator esf2 [Coemansia sp. RSA 2611]|nr:RNA-binding ATPase activator esf2 [Coemansia sp. RSA 2705]KAJ2361719.1 RNA-binding ATPase activator esf2 [Coemansia sp. RSA 2611]KAJ2367998.1 RNA-binding ATPase activator esf2 [Coemansia sp. RSA 2610]